MFGQNVIRNPHAFEADKDELVVTSIFYTLQGEGPFAGRPAVFVRLAYCNLACSFCDTYFDSGSRMDFLHIIHQAWETYRSFRRDQNFIPPTMREGRLLMVITGGEPLMQPQLYKFVEMALTYGFDVQMESNGCFYPHRLHPMAHLVVSPKLNEATRKPIKLNEGALTRANSLKFVISADEPGYRDVPEYAHHWVAEGIGRQVYLSPMNMYKQQPEMPKPDDNLEERSERERISFWTPGLLDMEKNQRNHEHAALLAMKYGFRLSLQQHLYAGLP